MGKIITRSSRRGWSALVFLFSLFFLPSLVLSFSLWNEEVGEEREEVQERELVMVVVLSGLSHSLPFHPKNLKQEEISGWELNDQFTFGQQLRREYIEETPLLPPTYQPNLISILAVESDKSITSLQALLLGLFPPGTGPLLPSSFSFNGREKEEREKEEEIRIGERSEETQNEDIVDKNENEKIENEKNEKNEKNENDKIKNENEFALPHGIQIVPIRTDGHYQGSFGGREDGRVVANQDWHLRAFEKCPRLTSLQGLWKREESGWNLEEERNSELLELLSDQFGKGVGLRDIPALVSLCLVERKNRMNKTISDELWNEHKSTLISLSDFVLSQKFPTREISSLGLGFLPLQIARSMEDQIRNESVDSAAKKMIILSTQIETFLSFSNFLQFPFEWEYEKPLILTLELYDKKPNDDLPSPSSPLSSSSLPENRFIVEIKQNGKEVKSSGLLQSESGGGIDFLHFLGYVREHSHLNWNSLCLQRLQGTGYQAVEMSPFFNATLDMFVVVLLGGVFSWFAIKIALFLLQETPYHKPKMRKQ